MVVYSLGYTEKAVVSARAARKKRWICFGIAVVIIIIIVIVIVVEVSLMLWASFMNTNSSFSQVKPGSNKS